MESNMMEQIKNRLKAKIELYQFLHDTFVPILMRDGKGDAKNFISDACSATFTYLENIFTAQEIFDVVQELATVCLVQLPEDGYKIFMYQFSKELFKFNSINHTDHG